MRLFPMKTSFLPALLTMAAVVTTPTVGATEGGGSIYPNGVENFTCCALPPPGLYGMTFLSQFKSDTLRDGSGNKIPVPGFKVKATAIAPRLVWVAPTTVLGASLALHVIVPLVDLTVSAAGNSQSKKGLGDIVFGPVLGWHHSPELHTVVALDTFAPTGKYNKGDLANIGRNYWSNGLVLGVSYIDPKGFNGDIKSNFIVNRANRDTQYKSGNEFIADYALGWGLGNGWVLGVGGHVYRQFSDDSGPGAPSDGNRGRAMSIGPSLKYDSGKGWFITAKWQQESQVRNRAEGNTLWFKAVFPL